MKNYGGKTMAQKRVLPPTYILVAIVSMVVLHFLLPGVHIIGLPWNVLGVIPLIAGIIMNLMADRAFKKAGTTVKPYQESVALITDGVFRVSRHPMYAGFVLILLGIAILLGSVTSYGVIIIFAVLMDVMFIRIEEHMLEETFGETWLTYKKQVRRWL
jgi:protein-S-isoprenylcysteine O-methyltransferase Ste14